ncbi:PqqD family peptide modification chaperone [Rhodococcoides kroppenstedtii]|uniref:PqqD family peptide modification chaperone n=1 Tax=Rhodococcoides kroppenstedtii TaxID=293050 RepID=UPI0036255FF7
MDGDNVKPRWFRRARTSQSGPEAVLPVELSQAVSLSRTDDGVIVLDGRSGAYWSFDHIAADILDSLLSKASTAETIADITAKYEAPAATVENDVKELLRTMASEGLVRTK